MSNSTNEYERLTPAQVETEYHIAVNTLKAYRAARRKCSETREHGPKYQKAGRKVLYRRSDIEAWLETKSRDIAA